MRAWLQRFGRWLVKKTVPAMLADHSWAALTPLDAYRRPRAPTASELLAELKGTAWTCASINAAAVASQPPRLFVSTLAGQPRPRCLTRGLDSQTDARLRSTPHLRSLTRKAAAIEEVLDHPLLSLLRQVNPVHNGFDFWTNTTLGFGVRLSGRSSVGSGLTKRKNGKGPARTRSGGAWGPLCGFVRL